MFFVQGKWEGGAPERCQGEEEGGRAGQEVYHILAFDDRKNPAGGGRGQGVRGLGGEGGTEEQLTDFGMNITLPVFRLQMRFFGGGG